VKIISGGEGGKKIIFFVHCTETCAILKHIQNLLLLNVTDIQPVSFPTT
jgi:hypothetical protein